MMTNEGGFAKLPAELRNMFYDQLCNQLSTSGDRLVVVIPNPSVPHLPKTRWSVARHIVWRFPNHIAEPALDLAGLTHHRWIDVEESALSYLKQDVRLPPPVYLLCREAHLQALQTYYQSLTFGFWSVDGFQSFLHQISAAAAASIRSVIVEVPFHVPAAFVHGESGAAQSFFQEWQAVWDLATQRLSGLETLAVQIDLHTPIAYVRAVNTNIHAPAQQVPRLAGVSYETLLRDVPLSRSIGVPLHAIRRMAAKKCRIRVLTTHHFEAIDEDGPPSSEPAYQSSSRKRRGPFQKWTRQADIPADWEQEISFTRDLIIANKAISLLDCT